MTRLARLDLALACAAALLAAGAVGHAQDQPPPDKAKADAPAPPPPAKADEGTKPAPPRADRSPDPNKAAPAGEALPPGTVPRKDLFPVVDGRKWRYELRTWLQTTSPEEGTADEAEPPRVHRLEVVVGESAKVEGRDARCLEYRLDDEPAQRAYYFEEAGNVFCPKRVLGAGEHAHDFLLVPPQPVLQGDLAVGASWSWSGKVATTSGQQRFEVLREERVKTKAGVFDTVVVRIRFTGEDDSNGVSVKWLSPNVGIVREETEVKADSQVYRTEAVLTKVESK